MVCVRRLLVSGLIFAVSFSLGFAADFSCNPPLGLAPANFAAPFPLNSQLSELLNISSLAFLKIAPLQQVNPIKAIDEALDASGKIPFSQAELQRQAQDKFSTCKDSADQLMTVFKASRASVPKLAAYIDRDALAQFVGWYINATPAEQEQDAVKSIVSAQQNFEKACLAKNIPAEMNPDLIKRTVGLLMFDNTPFCTALRLGDSEIITAKHCFMDPTGKLLPHTEAALSGGVHEIWFVYEAEPDNRFGVCATSLSKIAKKEFLLFDDNVRLAIRKPNIEPTPWTWVVPKSGMSLYLRSYFLFASDDTPLGRMRATAGGGCAAYGADDRCLFHACQTTQIMSGAPLFVRPEPGNVQTSLQVAGLQLGVATDASKTLPGGAVCPNTDGRMFEKSNFGYQPKGY